MSKKEKPELPKGWMMAGTDPRGYEGGVDTTVSHSGTQSAYMTYTRSEPPKHDDKNCAFGTLMQMFAADEYAGKRLKMTMWVKAHDVNNAQPWLRVDGQKPRQIHSFDNFCERRIIGTTDWEKYESILDVPEDSSNIALGVLMMGEGKLWFDDIALETVNNEVPTTDCPCSGKSKRKKPRNLNLEE